CGSLRLHHEGLAPSTRRRSPGAHANDPGADFTLDFDVLQAKDFTYVRRCSRKSSTAGVKVRPLSVTTATGKGRLGNLIGNSLRPPRPALLRSIDLGIAQRKSPVASR